MKSTLKLAGLALLVAGLPCLCSAVTTVAAPEIDPSMGVNALALLGGIGLVIRARRGR